MPDLLQGRFVWSELMTADTRAAERFYSRVVGWKTQPFAAGEPYLLWIAGSQTIGGLMEEPKDAKADGARPAWISYVGVNDADATARHARTLGGKVGIAPTDIPKVGRFAIVTDPQGAHIAILQPHGPSPTAPEGAPALGEVSWRELATTDVPAAMQFYRGLFGWEQLKANDMGPLGVYQEFGRFGRSQGGIYKKPPEMPGGPRWLMYAKVPDIQAAVATVKTEGGKVLNGPMEVPGGDLIAQIQDPQGADFALHQARS